MGGNLLKSKGGEGRRIDTKEKTEIETKLIEALWHGELVSQSATVESYRSKPDHGDIDLIICPRWYLQEPTRVREPGENAPVPPPKWFEAFGKQMGAKPVFLNGSVGTYDFDGVQIDINVVKEPKHVPILALYYNASPLGNILGTMIRYATDAHWGISGLFHNVVPDPINKPDHVIGQITFSEKAEDVARLAGLDLERWQKGFENPEEIYKFLVESPLFAKAAFEDDAMTHKHRIRERRRQDYEEWRVFCKEIPDNLPSKEAGVARLHSLFPNLQGQLDDVSKAHQDRLDLRRSKFNAKLVKEWTGIPEAELPPLFKTLRQGLKSRDAFDEWVDKTPQSQIRAKVLEIARAMTPSMG